MDTEKLYDRVVHSVAPILAQSWGLPLQTISMLLSTLQVMKFSLRIGFGDSDISYGGTRGNPFQDYTKGAYVVQDYGYESALI